MRRGVILTLILIVSLFSVSAAVFQFSDEAPSSDGGFSISNAIEEFYNKIFGIQNQETLVSENPFRGLKINEFVSNPYTGLDWVEIYNVGDLVNLSDCKIKDSNINATPLNLNGSINSGGFLFFNWDNRLNKGGDTITLICNNETIDQVIYGNSIGNALTPLQNQSSGRCPDGDDTGNDANDFEIFNIITKGTPNDCRKESCDYKCFIPDSLNDITSETIEMNLEENLQDLLANRSYIIDVENEQTNIQVWKATQNVQLQITYIGKIATYSHVFGYYLNHNKSTFAPLFEDNNHPNYNLTHANLWDSFNITVQVGDEIGFAIDSYGVGPNQKFYSENNLNPNSSTDHVLVFALCNEFIVAFNDQFNDSDYQDVVVSVKRLSCGEGCIPKTCEYLDKVCGNWDDGCGGILDCGPFVDDCSLQFETCVANGTRTCNNGNYYGSCNAQDPRTPEVCDDIDNDCDGWIDEGNVCGDCRLLDSDNDGVNNCDDLCPNSKPGEPVDEEGCDIFQFCGEFSCGIDCSTADWRDNENEFYPKDCKVILVSNEGQLYPRCVPTEFSNMCAG